MTPPRDTACITFQRHGGPEVMTLSRRPLPDLAADEVLIAVRAAGVNRPDILQRQGLYPPPPGVTDIPGLEVAGTIVAIGPAVTDYHIGDPVCALLSGGGYSHYAVANQSLCLPLPRRLDFSTAASLPETCFTVWFNLVMRGDLKAGDTVLVHGGSGGIGCTAIQIAALLGATVFATAGSDEKCRYCETLGATKAFNYHREDFRDLKALNDGRGADLILDVVGGDNVQKNIKVAAPKGRIISLAFLEGSKVSVDLMPVMLKQLILTGSTLRSQPVSVKSEIARNVREKLWPLVESGRFHPQVHAQFPLADATAAHRLMESREHIGKIVLTCQPDRNQRYFVYNQPRAPGTPEQKQCQRTPDSYIQRTRAAFAPRTQPRQSRPPVTASCASAGKPAVARGKESPPSADCPWTTAQWCKWPRSSSNCAAPVAPSRTVSLKFKATIARKSAMPLSRKAIPSNSQVADMQSNPKAPVAAAYGGWKSPITADMINRGTPGRDFPCVVDGVIYWQETRPAENGRTTVVARLPDGNEWDLLPYPLSTRSRVHEYGGRSWVIGDNQLFYVAQDDQRLYRLDLTSPYKEPEAISHNGTDCRFADLTLDQKRHRLLCVMEQHHDDGREPDNMLVAISLDAPTGVLNVLTSGDDFYAYPHLDSGADKVCWISWNHPNMPWDGTALWQAKITEEGALTEPRLVAGGQEEAIFQPGWSPDGTLYFVSDKNGWWNLYRRRNGATVAVASLEADFATPLWILGMRTWGFIDGQHIAALFTRNGTWHLGLIDTRTEKLERITLDYTQLSSLAAGEGRAVMVAGSASVAADIITISHGGQQTTIKSSAEGYDRYLSQPQPVSFNTAGNERAHGFYYPPRNPDFRGPDQDKPPLLVLCHGGPTGATSTALNYKIQYWTSRGFAVLDVNYRGSTGYGREYRQKLNGQWGIADVADACAGVDYLSNQGLIDREKVLIRGSSAGGFTVLAALTFTSHFRAGASLYGIGDLETLARDTHKFESHYLEKLIGPYPDKLDIYLARSPAKHTESLQCPVIFFQGLEDKVVPPRQAEEMVEALREKQIPVSYITFADEGHGFRKAANIKIALEAELVFYRTILGISSEEHLPSLKIENL